MAPTDSDFKGPPRRPRSRVRAFIESVLLVLPWLLTAALAGAALLGVDLGPLALTTFGIAIVVLFIVAIGISTSDALD